PSPTTRKDRPRPPTASSRPARSSTSSYCRPTKTDSVRWWGGGIAEIIPLSCTHGKDGMPLPASRSRLEAGPGTAAAREPSRRRAGIRTRNPSGGPDEIRSPLRAPDAEAARRALRVPLLPRGARADRARRPARVRHRVGGGAPLPDRVRPLLGPRDLPHRRFPAHEAYPYRPRGRAPATPVQPPDPRRRAGRGPRHHVGWPGRVRHRPLEP